MTIAPDVTTGTLLGGRVRYAQPAIGFRSGIEPVLLAAAVPARPGERVLECGSGAGAGLLCLATRVSGIAGVGIEIDTASVDLANANAAANFLPDLRFIAGDATALHGLGTFDHSFANPPYHSSAGTVSPTASRARAKVAAPGLFASWILALTAGLRGRGTVSVIVPATAVPDCLAAMAKAGCGSCRLLPLWPRGGRSAKLVILQAVRGGRGPFCLLPGLLLHEGSGFSAAANAVLREADPLIMGPVAKKMPG